MRRVVISENNIMELLHTRVAHRPAIVLEGYHQLSTTEQQQINESYDAMYDLLIDQVIAEMSFGGVKAKLKGAVAGAKAGFQGDQNAGNVGKKTEIQSLFDDVKKNIGTIVAQHKNDLTKMGMTEQDPAMQKLAGIEQAITTGGSGIEVKDSSMMGKAKQFGAEKIIPVVSKVVSPIMKKVNNLYDRSGPIKDFDTKYQQLVGQISKKHPEMSQAMSKFSELAKKHKGKATFIIGALTAILTATGALAAGGVAAFVVGAGLRGVYGMLAGEPPAKAFGKAAITAAIGKLAGGAFKDLFGDVAMSSVDVDPTDPNSSLGDMGSPADAAGDTGGELQDTPADAAGDTDGELQDTPAGDTGASELPEVQHKPSAEKALLDLDAKGLTMMRGDADGNIKDILAWSDEYTPTGSDYKSEMLADLKERGDMKAYRQSLFHMLSKAKEKEMISAFETLSAAAKEAGVDTSDAQAMMKLDPVAYQTMELARAQKMEFSAAYYEGDHSTHGQAARTKADMFRRKYNAAFPD